MPDNTPSSEMHESHSLGQGAKRKASIAGLIANGTRPAKSVKRRASKACQCCRARKVRCNVVEHGAPCTNCRLDEIECVVSESKRKKKWTKPEDTHTGPDPTPFTSRRSIEPQNPLDALQSLSASNRPASSGTFTGEHHVPHSIYQSLANSTDYMHGSGRRLSAATNVLPPTFPTLPQDTLSFDSQASFLPHIRTPEPASITLPYYLKSIPARIGQDELAYLKKKCALSVPETSLRNELLRSYVEYCHPFMPLLDLHDFLQVINAADGSCGKISLFTFSAVMFVGTAYVDFRHLQKAGYNTRKEARKDFFQKARLLYDFDYEIDRIALVQGLLLMTYWYETPDDQKDTWHYMGLAISLAHTIGLHRNPEWSNMDHKRKKLWRRIWWSLYMRDRLIALGMRRPTRIKNEDYDVPMMAMEDFEIAPLPDYITCIPTDCVIARDIKKQRQLAVMCIEKAKLCLCISQILCTQYSVLNNNQGILSEEGNTQTTMMLLPKKLDSQANEIQLCDNELQQWSQSLPEEAKYRHTSVDGVEAASKPIVVSRALLHLVFYCALSALHRPQVLPSLPSRKPGSELLEVSRRNVRWAASEITNISQNLYTLDLVKYLPTTGVTVLLPAIIIHLLDIKAPREETRRASLRGFCQCMQVMSKLRDNYAAADYSTAFLEAAIRKAEISVPENTKNSRKMAKTQNPEPKTSRAEQGWKNFLPTSSVAVDSLCAAGHNMNLIHSPIPPQARTLTPPPEIPSSIDPGQATLTESVPMSDTDIAARLNSFLASTPPDSSSSDHATDRSPNDSFAQPAPTESSSSLAPAFDPLLLHDPASHPSTTTTTTTTTTNLADIALFTATDFERDFDSLLNVDLMLGQGQGGGAGQTAMWGWGEDGGAALAMQGESSGFALDMEIATGMEGVSDEEERGDGERNCGDQVEESTTGGKKDVMGGVYLEAVVEKRPETVDERVRTEAPKIELEKNPSEIEPENGGVELINAAEESSVAVAA